MKQLCRTSVTQSRHYLCIWVELSISHNIAVYCAIALCVLIQLYMLYDRSAVRTLYSLAIFSEVAPIISKSVNNINMYHLLYSGLISCQRRCLPWYAKKCNFTSCKVKKLKFIPQSYADLAASVTKISYTLILYIQILIHAYIPFS